MPTVTLERSFKAAPERVFEFVSKTEHLLKWWGPESGSIPDHQLVFDRTGPWMSTIQSSEGKRYKVSGQVTHVDPPKSIGFTWAWHDESDTRGVESHVTIRLVPALSGGTELTLTHVDLPDDATAENHTQGWIMLLGRLENIVALEA